MKQRLLTVVLVVGCALLGVAVYLLYAGHDRKAPVITIEEQNISYTEGEKYDALLEGVSAQDDIDGDVTEDVFVDKVVPTKKGEAVVYYGVTDSSNNVGTARRLISYTDDSTTEDEPTEEKEELTNKEESLPEEPAEEKEDLAKESEKDEEEKKDPAKESGEDEEEKEDSEEELKPDGERPAIALTETEVTVKKGTAFDPISYVKGVVDDKDSRATLYTRISADGERNTDKAGTYTIRYYVKDSDGNTSEAKTLTLKVE